jgi:3-isopropylmalate/(R)-2-methylmalate dehydratase small subunit
MLVDNIDTDQIIPARFLKATDKQGMGEALFADWRYAADGAPLVNFVLNRPEYQGAQILLAGSNFGCGSSREHAPWALIGYGFRAVIATSFADIFRNNSLKNGLLPVEVDAEVHLELVRLCQESIFISVVIDLAQQTISLADSMELLVGREARFPIDPFSKKCLLEGVDEIGYLLSFEAAITAYEAED